jgi:hypothetical protein
MSEKLKQFVTQTLGCTCPEEVFNRIDLYRDVEIFQDEKLRYLIIIGGRLLLYIIEINSRQEIEHDLPRIIQHGIKEREEKGLNRIRIVIVTEKYNEIEELAQTKFESIRERDDRVHLHVIKREEFPQF